MPALCAEVDAQNTELIGNEGERTLCTPGAQRNVLTRGPIREIVIYSRTTPGHRPPGPHEAAIALRTARGWFAERVAPSPPMLPSYTPFERVRETERGIVFSVLEEHVVGVIDGCFGPTPHPRRRTIDRVEKQIHCTASVEGNPSCTGR